MNPSENCSADKRQHLGMNSPFYTSQVCTYILLFIHKEVILKASEHSWLEPSLLQKLYTEEEQLQSKCLQKRLCEGLGIFIFSFLQFVSKGR